MLDANAQKRRVARKSSRIANHVNGAIPAKRTASSALPQDHATVLLLFDENPLPMWFFDWETLRFLAVNDAAVATYGYSRSAFLRMTLHDIRPKSDVDYLRQHLRESVLPYEHTGPWQHVKRSGETITVDVLSIRTTFKGRPAVLSTVLDVTSRKDSDERIAASQRRLVSNAARLETLHAIDKAILTVGSTEQIADAALKRACDVLPCDRASLILTEPPGANTVLAVCGVGAELTPAGAPYPDAKVTYRIEQLRSPPVEAIAVKRDPANSPVVRKLHNLGLRSCAVVPLRIEGRVAGLMTIWSRQADGLTRERLDIAQEVADQLAVALRQSRLHEEVQRHAAELEQRVAERTASLQEVNNELQTFAYSVSHDLRAPVRAMRGFGQAVIEDYGHTLDDMALDFMKRIVDAADHMDRLIQDILAYSRMSRADLRLQPVKVSMAVKEALTQNRAAIEATGASIAIGNLDLAVIGHEQTLIQVLANLIANAITFTAKGRAPNIRISARRRGDVVRVTVKDRGIGIAPEHQERIFRIFERLHGMEEYPGTGIGLAIVRKGMERMDGRFGLESEAGKGSTFWVEMEVA